MGQSDLLRLEERGTRVLQEPKRKGAGPGRLPSRVLALVALVCLGFGSAAGQDSVDLWGARGGWSGKNAESFAGGYALGMSYVADIGLPVDVGIDALFARFDADQLTELVDEFQASALLRRWILDRASWIRPFVGARAGYTRLSADYEELKFEQNGLFAGPVVGMVLPTSRTLSPMVSLEAFRVRYEDTSLFLEGIELPQSGGYGWRFFLKMGVTFGSGWERRGR